MNWIREKYFFETWQQQRRFYRAVKDRGGEVFEVQIIPFIKEVKGKLPPKDEPTICVGSLDIRDLAKEYSPGAWESPQFEEPTIKEMLGGLYLNNDASEMTLSNVQSSLQKRLPAYARIFIKPSKDFKEFTGQLVTVNKVDEWAQDMVDRSYIKSKDMSVMVANHKKISREWRLIIMDGKVIAKSLYKENRIRKSLEGAVPSEVIDFAEQVVIPRYNPAFIFALDIASHKGDLYVIEANLFNCAGWYGCNIHQMINTITDHYEKSNISV